MKEKWLVSFGITHIVSLSFVLTFGYKVVEHGKPPVIVPEEAKIVRKIYESYEATESLAGTEAEYELL